MMFSLNVATEQWNALSSGTTNDLFSICFPNPSSDKINIEFSAEGHLSILNLNGQEIMNKPILKKSTQIDISSLPVGIYFFRFRNENTVQVRKIIKE